MVPDIVKIPGLRRNLWAAGACLLIGLVMAMVTWPRSAWAAMLVLVIGFGTGVALAAATLRREPHTAWSTARTQVEPGRAVIFWKPTCSYCTRLRRALRRDSDLVWVNVWVDADANREVRRHNGGDEYTPTALVGAEVLRNPSADQVRAAIGAPS